jgi:SAM-dependent methyltransferase
MMRLLTRALFGLGQTAARASIVINYAAAGTLNLADVKDGIRESWEAFHNREEDIATGLMDWERNLVDRFVPPGANVLIVGAGSGRDVIPLVERGCRVTGVEPASVPLTIARRVLQRRGLAATLVEGFFEDVSISGPFDVVMFSYYSYSYIPESTRRIAALRKAASLVTVDGPIVVSYPPLPAPHPVLITIARGVAAACRRDWRLEPGDHITIHSRAFRGFAHTFGEGEIERESAAAGLRIAYQVKYPDPVVVLSP